MSYAEAQVRFHFNYNHTAATAQAAVDLLPGRVLECRNRTNDILATIFDLEAEEVN
jgi:hypothetical protein